jgi:hypothetical protein
VIEEWKFAFQVGQFLLTGGIGIYVYLSNKNKVTNDRISAMHKEQVDINQSHGQRLAKLEATAENAPNHTDLSEVHKKVNEVALCLSRLEGEVNGMSRTMQLIHETMMEERRN